MVELRMQQERSVVMQNVENVTQKIVRTAVAERMDPQNVAKVKLKTAVKYVDITHKKHLVIKKLLVNNFFI